jgi:hypothetical protein
MFLFLLFWISFIKATNNTVLKDMFYLNNDNWNIIGNKNITCAFFTPFSLDGLMSNYIIGNDKVINVDYKNKDDANLWYFSKNFPTNYSLSNTSIFSFTMTSFIGDFTKLNYNNSLSSALIKIINNVTNELIIFPVNHLIEKYNGSLHTFVIPMVYNVWLNGYNYSQIDRKYFLRVLSNVTRIDILGDWTQGNETIGLDNVMIY